MLSPAPPVTEVGGGPGLSLLYEDTGGVGGGGRAVQLPPAVHGQVQGISIVHLRGGSARKEAG